MRRSGSAMVGERNPRLAPVYGPRRLAVLLGVLGFVSTAAGSWIPSLWGDEAATVMSAERSWPSLFAMLGHVDAVHGTYYAFMHLWIDAFGASAFSVRLPSAIATGLATAGLVVLAHRLGGGRLAVVSAIVYMIIPRVTYMGGEARGYALSAACAVWLTVLLIHLLDARLDRRVAWLGYAVLLAVSIYVFLYLALMIAVHAVIVRTATRNRSVLRRWLAASGLGLVLATPVIFFAIAERSQISFLAHRVTVDFASFFVDQWFGWPPFALVAWACIVAAFTAFIRRWWLARRSLPSAQSPVDRGPTLAVVTSASFLIPPLLLLTANLVSPLYTSRYVSFVTPAVALAMAVGICLLPRWSMIAGAVCVLVALSVPIHLSQRGPFGMPGGSDWAEVASFISGHAQRGDAIAFTEGGSPSLNPRSALHLYPRAFQGLDDVTLVTPYDHTVGLWDVTRPVARAGGRLARGDGRAWLVVHQYRSSRTPPPELTQFTALGFSVQSRTRENNDVIYFLTRNP